MHKDNSGTRNITTFIKTTTPCLLVAMASLVLMPSCKKDEGNQTINTPDTTATTLTEQEILNKVLTLPSIAFNYTDGIAPFYTNTGGINKMDNTPANNPLTNDGATLGRVLFYDKLLSANNMVSCASCHKQANSFSDPVPFSTGFANGKTSRNAMTLVNARYYEPGHFFWDERAASLEEQVLQPIEHPVEMGLRPDELENKLEQQGYYKILFRRAFGDTLVTRGRVASALAQFVRSLTSFHSKFDTGVAGRRVGLGGFANFTAQENNGMRIFNSHCSNCHSTVALVASKAHNNGLDLIYTDNGLASITGNPADNGKFKVPSLRNIAVTAPYMHDGRFQSLREVIDHYNNGIKNHPNLDPLLRISAPDGAPISLNLTEVEIDDIIAFLNTLTDHQFLTDARFSDPFKK